MKIEPPVIAVASLIEQDAQRATSRVEVTADTADSPDVPSYEDLLPYLLLPMAGAY
jgi:hypothetical protein